MKIGLQRRQGKREGNRAMIDALFCGGRSGPPRARDCGTGRRVADTVEDAPCGVALFARYLLIADENGVDEGGERCTAPMLFAW